MQFTHATTLFRLVFFSLIFLLSACNAPKESTTETTNQPSKTAQWINPILFNDAFDPITSFPIWFNDSLIAAHRITKITKRIYPRIISDTSIILPSNNSFPREKREFYFSKDGSLDHLIVYVYYDDREIARAKFSYAGKTDKNGYAKSTSAIYEYISDNGQLDFRTSNQAERKYNFVLFQFIQEKPKFITFQDLETKERMFMLKQEKYWGTLSVDSILKPDKEDWIVWGSMKHPSKIYKVETKVKESNVHLYNYYPNQVIKSRIILNYPLENRRNYLYNSRNQWTGYIDSTFSEEMYISRTLNDFAFDEFDRPIRMQHKVDGVGQVPIGFLETFSYSTEPTSKK